MNLRFLQAEKLIEKQLKSDMNLAIKAREGGLPKKKNLQRILLNQKEATITVLIKIDIIDCYQHYFIFIEWHKAASIVAS